MDNVAQRHNVLGLRLVEHAELARSNEMVNMNTMRRRAHSLIARTRAEDASLSLPLELDRPHQAALDLYGFEIESGTRYFDDTVIIAKQPGEAVGCYLVLSDSAEFWALDLNDFIHRNDSR